MRELAARSRKGPRPAAPKRAIYIYIAAALVMLMGAGFFTTYFKEPHPTVTVTQRNRHFIPNVITIKAGTVVHIRNDDTVTHHIYVKQPDMNFSSGEQPPGHAVDVLFDVKGVFDVGCAIHPTMHLKVIVR